MCVPVVGYAVSFNGFHLMGRGGEERIWIWGEGSSQFCDLIRNLKLMNLNLNEWFKQPERSKDRRTQFWEMVKIGFCLGEELPRASYFHEHYTNKHFTCMFVLCMMATLDTLQNSLNNTHLWA